MRAISHSDLSPAGRIVVVVVFVVSLGVVPVVLRRPTRVPYCKLGV